MQATLFGAKIFAVFSIGFLFCFVQFVRNPETFSWEVKIFKTEDKIETELKLGTEVKIATEEENKNTPTEKVILFWTKRYGSIDWGTKKDNITVDNCVFTHKRDFLDGPDKYDALMFHVYEKSWGENPKTRSPNQSYIMVTAE